jgi:N-acetylglucosaminyldiphosphoundecaprenol N-acetyl-beta-D-mannosaminyltransferase
MSGAAARPSRVTLRGVGFDRVREAEAVDHLLDALEAGRGGWVVTSNLDHLLRAGRDAEFRAMLDEADLVVADGAPLVWASRLQGTALPERVAGSSLVWTLSEAAAARGRSIFLLGGDPGAAEAARAVLEQRYPDLRIVGTHCPPRGFEHDADEMARIETQLRASQADLVYVALGSPKQEKLIRRLRTADPPVLPDAWWMGVGISLSFICGRVKRAPVWVQKCGLEWVHRLGQEPRRLARRYLVDGIPFAAILLSGASWNRLTGRRPAPRCPTRAETPRP